MIVQCKIFVTGKGKGLGKIDILWAERCTEVINLSGVGDKVIDVVLVPGTIVSGNTVYAL